MKKFYAFAVAVAAALSMNAQLYVVGSGSIGETALAWNPGEPYTVEAGANGYEFTLTQPNGGVKISTIKGADGNDWSTFNGGALYATVTEENLNQALALENQDANIMFPWEGDWKCVVAADFSTITVTALTDKPTGPAKPVDVYIRGGMNEWGVSDEWKFNTTDGVNYSLECAISAGVEFKIADANWGSINYGAGKDETETIYLEDDGTYTGFWLHNAQNSALGEDFEGTISFSLPASAEGLAVKLVSKGAGIDSVVAEENAPAVYYNLQGVKVANPENGVYVVRQGNKVSKVLVK